jgi:hypothetical protein
MYQFSRSIYRELAPRIAEDPADPTGCAKRQRLLDACEAAMRRLADDREHFARPTRTLFGEVRTLFSLNDQLVVYRVIERHVEVALDCIERIPAALGLDEAPAHCLAYTRKGDPCQRTPAPNSEYCPSHRHLEDVLPVPEPAEGLAVG